MKFQTEVEMPRGCRGLVGHGCPMLTLGSCFADEVGARLRADLFDIEVNPFGPLFNPASIARAVDILADGAYDPTERTVIRDGRCYSLDFHSRVSAADTCGLADTVDALLQRLRRRLAGLDVVMLTLGSANLYSHRVYGPVANCHKLPSQDFTLDDIAPGQVAALLGQAVGRLRESFNQSLKVIVTVSPVRHGGHSFHADRLSKSRLLLGVDEFVGSTPGAYYFPAYEIVQDQLRDYRFYAADMKHPSEVAVDFVYERFADTYFSPATAITAAECRRLTGRLSHRPLVASDDYTASLRQIVSEFAGHHPSVSNALAGYLLSEKPDRFSDIAAELLNNP